MSFGIYRGTVTANNDPEGLLRIKAKVPALLGEGETEWAWPCIPPGWPSHHTHPIPHTHSNPEGGSTGGSSAANSSLDAIVDLPSLESGVWIMFEGGDVNHPVWVGTWRKVA